MTIALGEPKPGLIAKQLRFGAVAMDEKADIAARQPNPMATVGVCGQ
ncbi:hypothetical protein [Mesorhizobium sp. M7A.F.Ca.US.001.04.1.1]|nr:hypothetical protein [Mesorhizobium sp. M7A.F.Ca.US.001.04.1.1]